MERIPGKGCAPVLGAMSENPRWPRALKDNDETVETNRRLAALIGQGQKNWPPQYQARFWQILLKRESLDSIDVNRVKADWKSDETDTDLAKSP